MQQPERQLNDSYKESNENLRRVWILIIGGVILLLVILGSFVFLLLNFPILEQSLVVPLFLVVGGTVVFFDAAAFRLSPFPSKESNYSQRRDRILIVVGGVLLPMILWFLGFLLVRFPGLTQVLFMALVLVVVGIVVFFDAAVLRLSPSFSKESNHSQRRDRILIIVEGVLLPVATLYFLVLLFLRFPSLGQSLITFLILVVSDFVVFFGIVIYKLVPISFPASRKLSTDKSLAPNNISPPAPLEEPKKIDGGNILIHGDVQGLVYGESNTITMIFHGGGERTVPFLAPPKPTYDLVGREGLLRDLKQKLVTERSLGLFAFNGLPGVGKTALALAMAHDCEVLGHFVDGVLWAGLGRETNVLAHLDIWGRALGISQSVMEKFTDLDTRINTIQTAIGMRKMLLVIDDAWSIENALTFKLGGPNCAYIVTTRIPAVADAFANSGKIEIHELSEEDGLKLIEQLAPGVTETISDTGEIRKLVHAVGGMPLSLILMGNFLRIQMHTGQPRRLLTALKRLNEAKERLELGQPQAGLERHTSLPDNVSLSLSEIIKISDEALDDEEPRQVLRALSVFPSKPNTFSEDAAMAIGATSPKTIDRLSDFGLMETSGPYRYTLHQTISEYGADKLTETAVYERMVKYFIEFVQTHESDRSLLERETSNILAAVEIMLERELNPPGASTFARFIRIVRQTRAI